MSETPRTVLERIEGWQRSDVEELDGGLTNRAFLVASGSKRAVLKYDDEPRGIPFNSREVEASVQRTAYAAGLAPAVLYSDERCLLVEFVEGEVWNAQHLRSAENVQKLGRVLQRVHALPRSGRVFDAGSTARMYADRIDTRHTAEVRDRIELIESTPIGVDLRLCHNDLVAENIIDTGELKFLDWEYACDNDPLFDLATVVAHHNLDEAQTDALLDAYLGGDWHSRRAELERQVSNYKALLWLWKAARE